MDEAAASMAMEAAVVVLVASGSRGRSRSGGRGSVASARSGVSRSWGRGRSGGVVAALLVNLDGVDEPVSISKSRWVGADVVLAGGGEGRAFSVGVPDIRGSSPVTAEGGVEDHVVVLEVGVNVATGATVELGSRLAPGIGVGGFAGDIRRNLAAGEEPNRDVIGSPLHGVNTASDVVETVTVVLVVGGILATASARIVGVAVGLLQSGGAERALVGDGTTRASVQGDGVISLCVDTLNNIDLARRRPVGSEEPHGRPDTTDATRHVGNVRDEQTMGPRLLRGHTNRSTTVGRVGGGGINAHVDGAVVGTGQTAVVGSLGVNILDIAVSGVLLVEEVELVKKVCGIVGGLEAVGGVGSSAEESREAEDEGRSIHVDFWI